MWEFDDIRTLAISQLSAQIDLVTQIVLGRRYDHLQWVFSGFEGLVKRKEAISVPEAEQLGLSTSIRLVKIREEGAAKRYSQSGFTEFGSEIKDQRNDDGSAFDRDCAEGIWKEFAEELKAAGTVTIVEAKATRSSKNRKKAWH